MSATWKTVRLFISSTFRDMHAERDHLVKVVFPRLRQWCERRRLHLVDIDLRWGVTQEEADNGQAIEICLQEIDGSRPFFLCLLGNRYGWVPDELPPEEMYQFRGLQAETHLSITHLEIRHAALQSIPTQDGQTQPVCQQAFFYFRSPACLPQPDSLKHLSQKQRDEYRKVFFEPPSKTGQPDRRELLDDLKGDIRRRYASQDRVFDYRGSWDARAENPEDDRLVGRLTDLEEFGRRVEADVKRGISEQFAEHLASLDQAPDPLRQERSLHEAFIEDRTQVHVPRTHVEERLNEYIKSDDARPLVISGPPGSGKSAILAHWIPENVDSQNETWTAQSGLRTKQTGANLQSKPLITGKHPSRAMRVALAVPNAAAHVEEQRAHASVDQRIGHFASRSETLPDYVPLLRGQCGDRAGGAIRGKIVYPMLFGARGGAHLVRARSGIREIRPTVARLPY